MGKAISCIVLAAGAGRRMGYKENKIFIPLGGYSIIQRTIQLSLIHISEPTRRS